MPAIFTSNLSYALQIVASGKESSLAQLQVIQNAAIRAALGLQLADIILTTELLRKAGQKSVSELKWDLDFCRMAVWTELECRSRSSETYAKVL
jgi:hypothetical protein